MNAPASWRVATTELLDRARGIIEGEVAVPGSVAVVVIAILARQALQLAVTGICEERGAQFEYRTPFASRIIVLAAHTTLDTAELVAVAWAGLSDAAHHHAYELPPTPAALGRLLDRVNELLTTSADAAMAGAR